MPSRDKINAKANEWMEREGVKCAAAITSKPKPPERNMSAQVQRIARRLGRRPDDLAKELPTDTVRRMKYPVLESRTPDGKREFRHDLGISEGPISR